MRLEDPLQLPEEVFKTISIPGFSDPVSSLTHLLGAGLFLVLGVLLVRRGRGHRGRMISLGVFAFSSVLLMSMSGVYHLLDPGGAARAVLLRLDHNAIFVLIAGTFTPVHAILFQGWRRWLPLFLIWSVGITAITLKTIFFEDVPEALGLSLYLGMGWLGLFSGGLVIAEHGWALIRPCLWGAFAYTLGAVLEFLRWPIFIPGVVGAHELFHLAVLAGVGFHWYFVWTFANHPVAGARWPFPWRSLRRANREADGNPRATPPLPHVSGDRSGLEESGTGSGGGESGDSSGTGCSRSPSQQFNSPRPPHSSQGRGTPPTQT